MRRKIILCNLVDRDISSFVQEAQDRIAQEVDLPPGYYMTFGGQFESQKRAMLLLTVLMGIVILIIFVVLFTSFGRLWQAFLIMGAIPITLIGGIIGLLVAGETLNVSSTIGLIALFGIGIQNDVILLAKINDYRKLGLGVTDAVIKGAVTKFRAIFMTNMVMIVGVLPLALSVSTGAELHRPLAVVYIGGFFFAILLKMIAVPVLYVILSRFDRQPATCVVPE
jgi:cobalt-zinc-cadmium resistance protein CzcA